VVKRRASSCCAINAGGPESVQRRPASHQALDFGGTNDVLQFAIVLDQESECIREFRLLRLEGLKSIQIVRCFLALTDKSSDRTRQGIKEVEGNRASRPYALFRDFLEQAPTLKLRAIHGLNKADDSDESEAFQLDLVLTADLHAEGEKLYLGHRCEKRS